MSIDIQRVSWRRGDIPQWDGIGWRQTVKATANQFWVFDGTTGLFAPRAIVASDIATLSPSFTNLLVSGWQRNGSLVTPTTTTAGYITAEGIVVPDQAAPAVTGFGLVNAYTNTSVPAILALANASGDANMVMQTAGDGPLLVGIRSEGTLASPTAVLSGSNLLNLSGRGFYSSTLVSTSQAVLSLTAEENWSASARGAYAIMRLTAPGTTTIADRHYWLHAGQLTVGYLGVGFGTASPPANVAAGDLSATRGFFSSIVDATTGYRIGGAAASGNVPRGNGTNFVSSTLSTADLSGGTWTTYSPAAGDFTAATGTWTAVTVQNASYIIIGKTMIISYNFATGTVSLATATLRVAIPAGKTAARQQDALATAIDNAGAWEIGQARVDTGLTYVQFFRNGGANWTAGTNVASIRGQIMFEIQ